MSDDKIPDRLFDYVLTRVRTRESSTLVIATVTTSASLVFFALASDSKFIDPILIPFIPWIAVFTAWLGIAYREVTILTIDQADYNDIHCMLKNEQRSLRYHRARYFTFMCKKIPYSGLARGIIFRIFLLLPTLFLLLPFLSWLGLQLLAWLKLEILFTFIAGMFVVVGIATFLSFLEWIIRKERDYIEHGDESDAV